MAIPEALVSFLGHHTVPRRGFAASARHFHFLAESRVDEVGDASPRIAVLVVARIGRCLLSCEHAHPVTPADTIHQAAQTQKSACKLPKTPQHFVHPSRCSLDTCDEGSWLHRERENTQTQSQNYQKLKEQTKIKPSKHCSLSYSRRLFRVVCYL